MQDNEIDLISFIKLLWKQKLTFIIILTITVFLGGVFFLSKDDKYEAKMQYSINTKPPFYDDKKIFVDFYNSFYSEKLFNNWKIENNISSINFVDFSNIKKINGFTISNNIDNQLAALSLTINPRSRYISVKSNNISIIKDFFLYSSYVSEIQKNRYLSRAKDELKIIKNKLKISSTSSPTSLKYYLSTDRFIVDIDNGGGVIKIDNPSFPELKSMKLLSKILILIFLGLVFAVFFIVMRNYVIMQKK